MDLTRVPTILFLSASLIGVSLGEMAQGGDKPARPVDEQMRQQLSALVVSTEVPAAAKVDVLHGGTVMLQTAVPLDLSRLSAASFGDWEPGSR